MIRRLEGRTLLFNSELFQMIEKRLYKYSCEIENCINFGFDNHSDDNFFLDTKSSMTMI